MPFREQAPRNDRSFDPPFGGEGRIRGDVFQKFVGAIVQSFTSPPAAALLYQTRIVAERGGHLPYLPVDTAAERSKGYAGHGQFLGRVVNTGYHPACTRYLAIPQKAIQAGDMVGFGQEFPIPIAEFLFLRAAEISTDPVLRIS